jgi:hypothetical protein
MSAGLTGCLAVLSCAACGWVVGMTESDAQTGQQTAQAARRDCYG